MTTIVDGREFSSPEMARAYKEAVEAVSAEHSLPPAVKDARRRALLRWISNEKPITIQTGSVRFTKA